MKYKMVCFLRIFSPDIPNINVIYSTEKSLKYDRYYYPFHTDSFKKGTQKKDIDHIFYNIFNGIVIVEVIERKIIEHSNIIQLYSKMRKYEEELKNKYRNKFVDYDNKYTDISRYKYFADKVYKNEVIN